MMADEAWWERLDLHIPERIPEDLVTRAACVRSIRRLCRDLVKAEHDYEALRERALAEGNEAALMQVRKTLDGCYDTYADLIHQVTLRMADLEAEAQQRADA